MAKRSLNNLIRKAGASLSKHSPEILIGLGITGFMSAVVASVKATPKALEILDEEKELQGLDSEESLPVLDVIKTTWKLYIPTAALAVASTACIICSHRISAGRTAALTTAYTLAMETANEYGSKVTELLSEETAKEVQDKIVEDKVKENPMPDEFVAKAKNSGSYENGPFPCFDPFIGKWFWSTKAKLEAAQNKINRKLNIDICFDETLNSFYGELDEKPIDIGDNIVWTVEEPLNLKIKSSVTPTGVPFLVIFYNCKVVGESYCCPY